MVTSLERVFRDHWGRVLAALIGLLGDFDLAELLERRMADLDSAPESP